MAASNIAQDLVGTGRRALAGTLAGGVWVAWGLVTSDAHAAPAAAAPILIACLLLLGCGYCIAKGRSLKIRYPYRGGGWNKGFLWVTFLEALGVAAAVGIAVKMQRLDLLPAWIGLVIGLHFLALAKVLRIPVYFWTGGGIVVWSLTLWALFRGSLLTVAAGVGIGAVLWATSSFNLVTVFARARSVRSETAAFIR